MKELSRFFGITKITAGGRRPAEFDTAHLAFGKFLTARAHHAHGMPLQRPAAGDEAQCVGILRRCGRCSPGVQERFAPHSVDHRYSSQWRNGQAHGGLGQPIDRDHGFGVKTVLAEALDKAFHSIGTDGLRAVGRQTPRTQVQALDIGVFDSPQAKFEGKVGSRGHRPPMLMNGPQPSLGPCQEIQRRHQHQ